MMCGKCQFSEKKWTRVRQLPIIDAWKAFRQFETLVPQQKVDDGEDYNVEPAAVVLIEWKAAGGRGERQADATPGCRYPEVCCWSSNCWWLTGQPNQVGGGGLICLSFYVGRWLRIPIPAALWLLQTEICPSPTRPTNFRPNPGPSAQCFGSASVLCGSGSYLETKCGFGSGSRIRIHALTK